jgi:hypothetical protein
VGTSIFFDLICGNVVPDALSLEGLNQSPVPQISPRAARNTEIWFFLLFHRACSENVTHRPSMSMSAQHPGSTPFSLPWREVHYPVIATSHLASSHFIVGAIFSS